MSVQLPKRKPGKAKVETTAFEVCTITRKLLSNEEIFPKRSRWMGCKDIAEAANEMLMCIFTANDVRVKTTEDARYRHAMQTRALAKFGALEKRMTFEAFYWERCPNLYEEWAGQMVELEKLLKNWNWKFDSKYAAWLGLEQEQT